ncbi:unnamed protein product [Amaranthus hypochondriacus]
MGRRYGDDDDDEHDHNSSISSSSSTESNTNNYMKNTDFTTHLSLGLTLSSSREQYSDWPPVKALLRSTLGKSNRRQNTLFVKVYMEGIPIGRKLDLLAHHDYLSLITTLVQMFRTNILSPNSSGQNLPDKCHVLTYEDKEGDWMMVGDVPWEMFLTTVKRLKITAFEKC